MQTRSVRIYEHTKQFVDDETEADPHQMNICVIVDAMAELWRKASPNRRRSALDSARKRRLAIERDTDSKKLRQRRTRGAA